VFVSRIIHVFTVGCVMSCYTQGSLASSPAVMLTGSRQKGARFGTAIAPLGDINLDHYNGAASSLMFTYLRNEQAKPMLACICTKFANSAPYVSRSVCPSVCPSVCQLVTRVKPAKRVNQLRCSLACKLAGPRNDMLDVGTHWHHLVNTIE